MTEKQAKQTRPSAVASISPQMRAYLETQTDAGEEVLWAGITHVSGRMRRLRPFVILCAFMMFLCSGLFLLMDSPSKLLLAVLSLLGWAGIAAFVVWRQSDHLRRTLYAVTDQRALILSAGNPGRTESYPPEKLEFIRPVAKAGGRGDSVFHRLSGQRPAQRHEFQSRFSCHR